MWKSAATGLAITPTGADGAFFPAGIGITIPNGDAGAPSGPNTFVVPELLSAIQNGCPGMTAMPLGRTSSGSKRFAVPAASETRFVCWNPLVEVCIWL